MVNPDAAPFIPDDTLSPEGVRPGPDWGQEEADPAGSARDRGLQAVEVAGKIRLFLQR